MLSISIYFIIIYAVSPRDFPHCFRFHTAILFFYTLLRNVWATSYTSVLIPSQGVVLQLINYYVASVPATLFLIIIEKQCFHSNAVP